MPKYWLSILSRENFELARKLDFAIDGYSERYLKPVLDVEPGDKIVYFIKELKGFVAICVVTSRCFVDWKRIWEDGIYPCRFERRCELVLPEGVVLPAAELIPRLSFISPRLKDRRWGLAFRGELKRLPEDDFKLIEQELCKRLKKS